MTTLAPTTPSSQCLDHAAYLGQSHFAALDGLRALAIIAVILHHVPRLAQGSLQRLQENGRYGVSFFFVISGFLIATLLVRERDRHGRIDVPRFYGRRAFRLLPLYYVALACECCAVFLFHLYSPENQLLFRDKLPAYLLYYSNWLPTMTQGPFFFSWSLAAEEQFYLVFALLMAWMPTGRVVVAALAAWVVKMVAVGVVGGDWTGDTLARILFSYQEPILIGVLVAFLLHHPRGYRAATQFARTASVALAATAILIFLVVCLPFPEKSALATQGLHLAMALILVCCVIRKRVPLVSNPGLCHVGKISYGIYLLHMYVIMVAKKLLPTAPGLCFAFSTIVVIGAASLVYRWFEAPIIAWSRKWLTPRPRDPEQSVG